MLQKLLKYDLRHIFKYWWILALASLGFSIIGGVSFNIIYSFEGSADSSGLAILLMIAAILGIFISILGICAFIIGNEIFIFERFYRNFFTDEGYLTFTLPVKRSTLLNSKIIMAFIANTATIAVAVVDLVIMFALSPIREEFTSTMKTLFPDGILASYLQYIPEGDRAIATAGLIISVILIVLFLAVEIILGSISGTLLIYGCITVASVITKKYKLLAAIGIYYAVSSVFSFVIQIGSMFMTLGLEYIISSTPESLQGISTILVVIIQVIITAVMALALYTMQLRMLDKKLNLS